MRKFSIGGIKIHRSAVVRRRARAGCAPRPGSANDTIHVHGTDGGGLVREGKKDRKGIVLVEKRLTLHDSGGDMSGGICLPKTLISLLL